MTDEATVYFKEYGLSFNLFLITYGLWYLCNETKLSTYLCSAYYCKTWTPSKHWEIILETLWEGKYFLFKLSRCTDKLKWISGYLHFMNSGSLGLRGRTPNFWKCFSLLSCHLTRMYRWQRSVSQLWSWSAQTPWSLRALRENVVDFFRQLDDLWALRFTSEASHFLALLVVQQKTVWKAEAIQSPKNMTSPSL